MAALGNQFTRLEIICFTLKTHGHTALYISPTVRVQPTNSRSKLSYVVDAIRIGCRLRNITVISAQDPFEAGLAAYSVHRRLRAPLQLQLHTDMLSPFFARGLNRVRLLLARYLIPRADGIRVTTERSKQELVRMYNLRVPVAVLPVYTDISRFSNLGHKPHSKFAIALLWLGRFEEEKNPGLAIRALCVARRNGFDAGLVLLGSGRQERMLRLLAARLKVAPWIEFVPWSDPIAYVAQADIVLCTSHYEGYGLAIVEALAAGVPVLSTDVGIAREAGAIIAAQETYADTLSALLPNPPTAHLRLPLMSEVEYCKAYKNSLAEICR